MVERVLDYIAVRNINILIEQFQKRMFIALEIKNLNHGAAFFIFLIFLNA